MGILPEVAARILALELPRGFSVCELGDQGMAGGLKGRRAQTWYAEQGCSRYVSIDANGSGTLLADLNLPLMPPLLPFDLVTDFGTGEHIFDQAQVWRTLHELTKTGGYIAVDRPSQGYGKHGYYQVNRCLFEDLAHANDYSIVWLETTPTPRGTLARGIFRRPDTADAFVIPQQGRYRKALGLP